jgi:hypothetical protein
MVCDNLFGTFRLRQTGKNYLGQRQPGIEFLYMFGRAVYKESPSNSPRQPDWDRVPDLTSPLNTKQFGDMIGRCFRELGPGQVMELVRRFFPGLNATQAMALTRDTIPVLTAAQAIELLQEFFPELDAPEVIGLVRRIEWPALHMAMKGVFRKGPPIKKVKIQVDRQEAEIDVPEGIIARGLSGHLSKLIAVVGLRGGSRVTGGRECRFIRLVNIGRNHDGEDCLCISAWEIFGSLIE